MFRESIETTIFLVKGSLIGGLHLTISANTESMKSGYSCDSFN
jgi:hypothetical protein